MFGRKPQTVGRAYAIGDVHGRFDLLERLLAIIQRDNAGRMSVGTQLVLLGNIVDRGPDAKRLCELCLAMTLRSERFVLLKGNHEAIMAMALSGDMDAFELWQAQGGRETLVSWGVPGDLLDESSGEQLLDAARAAIGEEMIAWLSALPLMVRHGDYLLVHAGIRPGVELKRQVERDLLWIRDDFLKSKADHGVVVVHGHATREAGPEFRPNRIGIDTGAFKTGRLTAIGLEGAEHWTLMTEPAPARPRTAEVTDDYLRAMTSA